MADVPLIFVDADVYLDVITRNEKPHPETQDPAGKWAANSSKPSMRAKHG